MLPREQILRAFKTQLEAIVPLEGGSPKWKVRHHRHRDTAEEEMPCVAIKYVADDAPGVVTGSDVTPSLGESIMEMRLDLIIDTPIPPESDRDTAEDPDEGADPTGLGLPNEILEETLKAIFKEGEEINDLGGLIWDARYDGTGDNDDLVTPDNVRLAERLTLVYRVRAEAPHVLLTGG